ncbi:hypothetical protein [Magnetospirillum sp. UT-4]|uniref:hypothetical protein n=1 Tax=Magnetospirillum sp. UT-4 TaxID=2681467 RepID=UPI00138435DE|nr:hypothetical protein [Magnetospirillum sp. UT-4]CAA7623628.1 conserved hypothetical protein [Magnetospirillum sp. UT-4]
MTHDFDEWITQVFAAATAAGPGVEEDAEPARALGHLTRLWERPEVLTDRFSADDIGRMLWFLVDPSCSSHGLTLGDESLPWLDRSRAIRAIAPLYNNLLARQCQPELSHGKASPVSEINMVCYMFWDICPLAPQGAEGAATEHDETCLTVLASILAIPHPACQEGALHGLGHWAEVFPKRVAAIVDEFLYRTEGVSDMVRPYAWAVLGR